MIEKPPRRLPLAAALAAIGILAMLSGLAACSSADPSGSIAAPRTTAATPAGSATATVGATATDTPVPTASATFTPWATLQPTLATGNYTYNVYNASSVRWQNPDLTACVASSTQMMLNMATYWNDYTPFPGQPKPQKPQGWKPDTSYTRQEQVLAYARKNTTQVLTDGGADAHGWRNALNYYGWGHNSTLIFKDLTYGTFDDAARATVSAIAIYRKPVGILALAGQHAQIVTGYKVFGYDPRSGSTKFTIQGVYVTDPLKSDGYRNAYIPIDTWRSGGKHIRFVTYKMTNSPFVDPIDGQQGNAEWDGKWVIVAPVA